MALSLMVSTCGPSRDVTYTCPWCFLPIFLEWYQLLCSNDRAQVSVRLCGRGGLQQQGGHGDGAAERTSEERGQQSHRGPAPLLPAAEGGCEHRIQGPFLLGPRRPLVEEER